MSFSLFVWSFPITDQVLLLILCCGFSLFLNVIWPAEIVTVSNIVILREVYSLVRRLCNGKRMQHSLCFFVYAMLFNMFFHYLISVFVVSIRASQPRGQKPLEGLGMLLRDHRMTCILAKNKNYQDANWDLYLFYISYSIFLLYVLRNIQN